MYQKSLKPAHFFTKKSFSYKNSFSSLISFQNKLRLMTSYQEPDHAFLVFIAHAISCSLNMHGQLSSGARCLCIHPFYMCTSSEESDGTTRMRRCV